MPESRERYFKRVRAELAAYYLAEPDNPYRQSGRGSGAERWQQSRRCIADAVDRDGDFMDIGCANGLLLESLLGWADARGIRLRPHGVDYIPELVELARGRFPGLEGNFEVANAFYWQPRRRYDYVRTELVYVPPDDYEEFARRLYDLAVAPGGQLIVCNYRASAEGAPPDAGQALRALGFTVAGVSGCPGTSVAWTEKPGS